MRGKKHKSFMIIAVYYIKNPNTFININSINTLLHFYMSKQEKKNPLITQTVFVLNSPNCQIKYVLEFSLFTPNLRFTNLLLTSMLMEVLVTFLIHITVLEFHREEEFPQCQDDGQH